MRVIKLGKKEQQRLEKIDQILSPPAGDPVNKGFAPLVREHFNAAAIREAMTAAEKKELRQAADDLAKGLVLNGKPAAVSPALASLRANDIFAGVARRVVKDDKAIAAVMPGTFTKKDAKALKKHKFSSLAALAEVKLEN
jgi:hypothetical protein